MRYKVLDSWRGIAAVFVAAFHFPVNGLVHSAALMRHAWLFVDFFFVLSGFVIAHALRDGLADASAFRAFMIRRLGRVYPLYVVMLVAFVAVEALHAGAQLFHISSQTSAFAPNGLTDPDELPRHLALLQVFGFSDALSWNWPDWSIAAEVWTYAVFGMICLMAFSHRRALLTGLCAMALAIMLERSNRGIEVTYDLGFLRCLYSFAAGALVYEAWQRIPFKLTGVLATACEWATLLLALTFVVLSGRNVSSFAAPAVFGLLILTFAFEGGGISRLLSGGIFQMLGTLSYSIYMVHALIVFCFTLGASAILTRTIDAVWSIETYDKVSLRILQLPGLLPDAFTCLYLAIVVLTAAVVWRFIERPARLKANAWAAQIGAPNGLPASMM